MPSRPDLRELANSVRDAFADADRETLLDVLTFVLKEYVVEGPPPMLIHQAETLADLQGVSFAQLVSALQTRFDHPELAMFIVDGEQVGVRVGGVVQPLLASRQPLAPASELPRPAAGVRVVETTLSQRPPSAAAPQAAPQAAPPYEPGSRFSAHPHELGEEFFVLSGTFSDEWGDYPAGTYVRNPPGSSHTPASANGCEIFVKLRQFDPEDTARVVIDTTTMTWQRGAASDIAIMPLHAFGSERVALVRLADASRFDANASRGGVEILMLEGTVATDSAEHPAGTWMRFPAGQECVLQGRSGANLWMKTGHLAQA
jgi:anti-sigma factor ChrR (cupin superfamily)